MDRRIVCADTVFACAVMSSATSFGALMRGLVITFLEMLRSSLVVNFFGRPFCLFEATLPSFLNRRTMSQTLLDFFYISRLLSCRKSFHRSKVEFLPLRAIFV